MVFPPPSIGSTVSESRPQQDSRVRFRTQVHCSQAVQRRGRVADPRRSGPARYPPLVRLFVTTATGVLSTDSAPVGGGVAVLEALLPHLAARDGLEPVVLRPGARSTTTATADGVAVRELAVPTLADGDRDRLLALDERAYARFALEWERALGRHFEGVDPDGAVVLANDVSEGPPFARLAARGFRQAVIYHVVVGEFFARRYLRRFGRGPKAATAARWWRRGARLGLRRVLPRLLDLVWTKEEAAARHATAICPSPDLAASLAALYPASGVPERTHVVPWGVIGAPDPARRDRRAATLARHGVDPGRRVLLTLSRLSPEKRLELSLDALRELERVAPDDARGLALVVAGAPAYMGGAAYARALERRARALRLVAVRFVGYVGGDAKWDLLSAADLFLSTSSYEAYGLGIAQALASGTPVVATEHEGARAILTGLDAGRIVPARAPALAAEIRRAGAQAESRRARAVAWGAAHPFDLAAERVSAILLDGELAEPRRAAGKAGPERVVARGRSGC